MRHGLIQEVTEAIENELSAANKAFPGFNSTHEGYAVILEESECTVAGNADESVTEADQRDCGSNTGKRTGNGSRSNTDSSHGRKADPVHGKAGRMNAAAVIAIAAAAFLYVEAAIGTGYYMYLITRKKTKQDATKEERKQLTRYSIIAGVAFPVTFAILFAARAAERK